MHRSTLTVLAVVLLAPVLAVASGCSGAQAIDFGEVDSGSGSGSGGGSGGGSGSSSGVTAQDSGPGVVDSGQLVDSVSTVDVVEQDSSPVDEPPPATGPSVACPMNGAPATCQAGDYCCVVGTAMDGNQSDTCEPATTACTGGTPVRCASAADCSNGQVCCGTETTDPQTMAVSYTEVTCATTCALTNQRTFCDPSDPSACPSTAPTCGQSQLLPGYTVCQMM